MITEPLGAPRVRVLGRIADHLVARRLGHPLRVAVDGVTAAGKTTLARELAAAVVARGRPAAHLSMDALGQLDDKPIIVSGSFDDTIRVWDLTAVTKR